jgi:hypothetical protein
MKLQYFKNVILFALLTAFIAACGSSDGGTDFGQPFDAADSGNVDPVDEGSEPVDEGSVVVDEGNITPPDEGQPDTTQGMVPCEEGTECDSGFCIPTSEGKVCALNCVDSCPDGFACQLLEIPGQDPTFVCLDLGLHACQPCNINDECRSQGGGENDRCTTFGDYEGSFCTVDCSDTNSCESGYACTEIVDAISGNTYNQCLPESGSCECSVFATQEGASTECGIEFCSGNRACGANGLTECTAQVATDETCDGLDNNCNGLADDDLGTTSCGVGVCAHSTPNCSDGVELICDPFENQTAESCDELDNDCDGHTDEDCTLFIRGYLFGDGFVLGASDGTYSLMGGMLGPHFVGTSSDGTYSIRAGLPPAFGP